jgi:hypothetical protein
MISRSSVRTAAKALAQDAGPGTSATGVQLLLRDPGDYNLCLLQALKIFTRDKPHLRIVDHAITVAGFRFALAGSGALSSLAGLDAFVLGASQLQAVYLPWDVTSQDQRPLDENVWRVVLDPGQTAVLELLDRSASVSQILRLIFSTPHQLTEAPNTVVAPSVAATSAIAANGAGNVTAGTHSWVYTWVTAQGETPPAPASNVVDVTAPGTQGQVTVTVQASGDPGVTHVRLYRTVAGNTGAHKRVLEQEVGAPAAYGIALTDNVGDGGLGGDAPSTNTAGGQNTVYDADEEALSLLAASLILEVAAVKAAQNTGNSGLPTDIVDRRTQSDIYRSRSKELREFYNGIVGLGSSDNVPPASAFRDLDLPDRYGYGRLWHSAGVR